MKLLCRLYDPQQGSVEIDGRDLREFRVADVRRNVTALFQEPVHYNATAAESIAMGTDASPEAIREAAWESGAAEAIEKLPKGYDSLLGKWYEDGVDLSTGEWQKVALARAFIRQAPLIVLDEPTSAMDPWAEAEWLDRFQQLAAGRTAVIITHRLTTAMRADWICLMMEGQVVEQGTHDDLLSKGGPYAAASGLRSRLGDTPGTLPVNVQPSRREACPPSDQAAASGTGVSPIRSSSRLGDTCPPSDQAAASGTRVPLPITQPPRGRRVPLPIKQPPRGQACPFRSSSRLGDRRVPPSDQAAASGTLRELYP